MVNFLAPGTIGADVTIFNPDPDPDGRYAIYVVKIIVTAATTETRATMNHIKFSKCLPMVLIYGGKTLNSWLKHVS